MSSILKLNDVGSITSLSQTLENVNRLSSKKINEEQLVDLAANGEVSFFNSDKQSVTSEEDAIFKLVLLKDIFRRRTSESIYLLFRRKEGLTGGCITWNGTLVGTELQLLDQVSSKKGSVLYPDSLIQDSELERLYDLLLSKESWRRRTKDSLGPLRKYLRYAIQFSHSFLADNYGVGAALNTDASMLAFNTRLYSKFGDSIIMCAKISERSGFYDLKIVDSLDKLLHWGFGQEQFPMLDVNMADISKDFVFICEEKDLDTASFRGLEHVIGHRVHRTLSFLSGMNEADRIAAVQNSIRLALGKIKVDPLFARPVYSSESNEINFLIPLLVGVESGLKPESALILKKNNLGKWVIATVLPIEAAYLNARIVMPVSCAWLKGGEI